MIAINYTTARDNLKKYCDAVVHDSETVVITRKQGENVVIMSEADYSNIMENIYIRRSPANLRHLEASIAEFANSAKPKIIKSMEELEAMADE